MWWEIQFSFFLLLVHYSEIALVQGEPPTVQVNEGRITGVRRTVPIVKAKPVTVEEFLGVPFAEPPVGARRFRPPVPKKPWGKSGYYAHELSKACYQEKDSFENGFKGSDMWNAEAKTPVSEDCLYLNIWRPHKKDISPKSGLAVMVWIFGGGFFSGSPSLDLYDGAILAGLENVIVVNINYRVSIFGNLYLDHRDAPGNVGFLDQQLALKWVYENIKEFGGDPSSITLFGESAGSASVSAHLIAPDSKQYVNRVIMQSGSMLAPWACKPKQSLKEKALRLADKLNCYNFTRDGANPSPVTTGRVVQCLRHDTMSSKKLSTTASGFMKGFMNFGFVPVCEDANFFQGNVHELIAKERFKRVPAIVGIMSNEGSFWLFYYLESFYNRHSKNHSIMSRNNYLESVKAAFKGEFNSSLPQVAINAISHHYDQLYWTQKTSASKSDSPTACVQSSQPSTFYRDLISRAVGDYHFVCSCLEFGNLLNPSGQELYFYKFDAVSTQNPWPSWAGAMHGYEIEFIFGMPLINEEYKADERRLSRYLMKSWAGFAKRGKPTEDLSWPETGNKKLFKVFDTHRSPKDDMVFPENVRGYECTLWNQLRKLQESLQPPKTSGCYSKCDKTTATAIALLLFLLLQVVCSI